MGNGASVGVESALRASSENDLKEVLSKLTPDARDKLLKATVANVVGTRPAVLQPASYPASRAIFETLFDASAQPRILAEDGDPLFHEAGVWMPQTCEWLVTSNRLKPGTDETHVRIIALHHPTGKIRFLEDIEKHIRMGNGGTSDFAGGAYLLDQGFGEKTGAIWKLDPLLKSATCVHPTGPQWHNSLNDIVLHKSSGMFIFTDPAYGYYVQSFRTKALTNTSVWMRKADDTFEATVVDSDYCAPNGILLSPDEKIMYVTDVWDTEWINGDDVSGEIVEHWKQHKGMDTGKRSQIVAYDVNMEGDGALPTFTNRRIFVDLQQETDASGFPDGIKCDIDGNIYAGCGDGVRVYSPDGTFLGRIKVEGGVANLCFGGPDGRTLLMLAEKRAITVQTLKAGALPPYTVEN